MNELRALNDFFDVDPMDTLLRGLARHWRADAGERVAPRIRIDLAETDAAFLVAEAQAGRQTAVVADLDALTDLALAIAGGAIHHMLAPAPGA